VHNFYPDRWPAGNPETDFGNCDPGPTKEVLKTLGGHFYDLSFGKRLPDELYRLADDPECVRNLANELAFKNTVDELRYRMLSLLQEEGDPRALGQGEILEVYKYLGARGKGYETWLQQQEATVLQDLHTKLKESPARKGKEGKKQKKKASN
jgi:hypothetical protein